MSAIVLLIVTMLSAALAAVMSVIAWRMARDEKERGEVRISALAAEIHSQSGDNLDAISARVPVPQWPIIGIRAEPSHRPAAAAPPQPVRHPALAVIQDLPLRDAPMAAASSTHLFEPGAPPSGTGLRLASGVALGVFVVATAAAVVVWLSTGPPTAPVGPVPAAVSQQAIREPWPLELVTLGYDREGDRLTIRGVVRNPASGAAVDRLTAVVFVFNHDGGFVTSANATVATAGLEPGRESTFVVAIPNAGAISRYRVSFRTGDRVVPHIDKRESSALARVQ